MTIRGFTKAELTADAPAQLAREGLNTTQLAPSPDGQRARGGVKFDADKPPMDLIDPVALEELAKVLGFGAAKYAKHNWRAGLAYSRLTAAALRHITAFNRGEDLDPETGLPHPAHAMCCMMFLVWMMRERPDQDDRWRGKA